MFRHGDGRPLAVVRNQRLDNREVLVGFFLEAMEVVMALVVLPRKVAEGTKEHFQPTKFLGEKCVTARRSDHVVKSTVDCTCLINIARRQNVVRLDETYKIGSEFAEHGFVDPSASASNCFAFQSATNVTNLANLFRRNLANDRPAVGEKVDHTNPGEGDQRLANGGMAHAEAIGQCTSHKVLTRTKPAVKDVFEQTLDNRPPALTVVDIDRPVARSRRDERIRDIARSGVGRE